jgi:hypothetical protein
MSRHLFKAMKAMLAGAWLLLAFGCGSSGSTHTSYGYYSGSYWNDPYYRYPCCRGDTIVVTPPRPGHRPPGSRPPPGQRPPGHRPPGHRPPGGRPTQLPSRPRPRPMPRARAR